LAEIFSNQEQSMVARDLRRRIDLGDEGGWDLS
jgi:hypothetical protein